MKTINPAKVSRDLQESKFVIYKIMTISSIADPQINKRNASPFQYMHNFLVSPIISMTSKSNQEDKQVKGARVDKHNTKQVSFERNCLNRYHVYGF